MKWPASVTLVRHGKSAYNALRDRKNKDVMYQAFVQAYDLDYRSAETRELAEIMRKKYALGMSDHDTPLTLEGVQQSRVTGSRMRESMPLPDVIFYSPYIRADQTLMALCEGWNALYTVKRIADDRIREQEHGLSLLYSDWRIYHAYHPEQKELRDLLGPYYYQFQQGESVSQVRERARNFFSMLIRECAGMRVLIVTHHLTILSIRANLERLSPELFIHLDKHEKPFNCGVTNYLGKPNEGANGKLVLDCYNLKLYK